MHSSNSKIIRHCKITFCYWCQCAYVNTFTAFCQIMLLTCKEDQSWFVSTSACFVQWSTCFREHEIIKIHETFMLNVMFILHIFTPPPKKCCHYLFTLIVCWTQNKIFYRTMETTQHWKSVTPLYVPLRHSQNIFFCISWNDTRWVNDYRPSIFGLTFVPFRDLVKRNQVRSQVLK